MLTHVSLFSGIGGFDLAAQWMGWTNIFTCEIEEFPRTILKHHFPEAIHYEDIKRTDFTVHHGSIDILTGGFPCQPFSVAGKRLGKHDERHLWPEMFRAIREIRPRFIVGENVRGLLNWSDGLVLDEVYSDLEAEGYEVQAFVLPAAGLNAPHKRDRVWIVASNADNARARESMPTDGEWSQDDKRWQRQSQPESGQEGCTWNVANANSRPLERTKTIRRDGLNVERKSLFGTPSNADSRRWNERCECEHNSGREWEICENKQEYRNEIRSDSWICRCNRNAANPNVQRCKERYTSTFTGEQERQYREKNCYWGDPGESWERFPTQPPVCGRDDGFPVGLDGITFSRWRRESIKAYGNAIVPQVAYRIFKAIEHTM